MQEEAIAEESSLREDKFPNADQFPNMETHLKMNVRRFLLSGFLLVPVLAVPLVSEIVQQPADNGGQSQAPNTTQTATLPTQSQGSAPLRVMVGKSLLINTTERLKRISLTDPAVAYATPITPTQILVHGKAPGEVSLLIWDELERSRSFDLAGRCGCQRVR